jgi:LPS-assembly protein
MSKSYSPYQQLFIHFKIHGWAYLLSTTLFCLQDVANAKSLPAAPTPVLNNPLSLKLDDQLQVPEPVSDNKVPTFTKSGDLEGVNDRNMILKRDAEIRRNGTVIKGDELDYNLDTDIANGNGNVKFNKPNASFAGPKGQIKLDSKEGWMESPQYEIKESHGSGHAERAEFLDDDRTYLTRPTYSTCSPQNLDWYFSSKDMLIDQSTNDATGNDGVLHFFDTPIFYMPYYSIPISGDRRSGFLPPTIGLNTNTGFDITSPYYLNIAPNRDLTLYPRLMSKRGTQLGGEFRYLEPTYSGILKAEYLPNDNIYGANRWAYSWQHQQYLAPGLTAYANISRVSDDLYADDLGRSVGQAITRQYTQEAGVNYYVDGWNFLTRVQKYQTLQPNPGNIVIPPYDREPELNASYRNLDWNGSIFTFQGNVTRFTYTGPLDAPGNLIPNRGYSSADRAFINTGISYPFTTPGYYFTPKASFRANTYNMLGNENYPGATQSFALPIMSLDSGLFFERDAPELASIFGRKMLMTLEPRAFYVYSPYRDQSQIPLFDTASAGFGIAQIFSENTFVGNDRIADNNKLTLGVTSKILDADTGVERIRGTIAQRFDFTGQQVGLNGNQTNPPSYSDILFGVSTRLSSNVNLDFANQYNQDLNRTVQSSTTASWRPAPRKMLNLSYRYTYDTTAMSTAIYQYELSGQWPITKSINVIGRWNYDEVTQQSLNTLAGLEYDQDCWAFRVALNRYVNTSQVSTTQIFFQIEFKGLTGVGNNPIDIMKLNIPGYIPSNQKPLPLSRFETYE